MRCKGHPEGESRIESREGSDEEYGNFNQVRLSVLTFNT